MWEELHNPDFKTLEFEGVRKQAGANAFTMSPKKWIEAADAIEDNLIPPELTPVQIAYAYANREPQYLCRFGVSEKMVTSQKNII